MSAKQPGASVSNNESFIDEVSEAVRRDQLFATFRRYGWIAALLVIALVGGAAWNEVTKARKASADQARGDAILAAMDNNDSADRVAALQAVEASTISQLLLAAEQQAAGETEAAAAALDAVANDAEAPMIYRQIAGFKAALLRADDLSPDDRIAAFSGMAVPGQPIRLLAQEQVALAQIDKGDVDAALVTLQTIDQDAETTRGLRDRVQTLIVALGGTPVVSATTTDAGAAAPSE